VSPTAIIKAATVNMVSIINLALERIGIPPITSLEQTTSDVARRCNVVISIALPALLRMHDWNFARGTAVLSLVDTVNANWAYVYALPTNCLRVLKVYAAGGRDANIKLPYELIVVNGTRCLATNIDCAIIDYTAMLDDATLYDPLFSDALAFRLAADLAPMLTGDRNLGPAMMQQYLFALGNACRVNSNEAEHAISDYSTFADARQ
jgi:hypothetical protein